MSADRATYLDSSTLVRLVVREPESAALRRYLRRRRPLVTSTLADLAGIVTYDEQMTAAAERLGLTVARPS